MPYNAKKSSYIASFYSYFYTSYLNAAGLLDSFLVPVISQIESKGSREVGGGGGEWEVEGGVMQLNSSAAVCDMN